LRLFVSGTDTNVGKTIFAAALAGALDAHYWKPVQAGDLERSDSDRVRVLSGLAPAKVLTEAYRLATACSPHRAAEIDCVEIETDRLSLPDVDPLVVEGAGGLLVPLSRDRLLADLLARWQLPVVLVARTALGTINHSLLSIHALRSWGIPLLGIAFVGDSRAASEDIICEAGGVRRLGRLPCLERLDAVSLRQAFLANFNIADFQ